MVTEQLSPEVAKQVVQLGREQPDVWGEQVFGVDLWSMQKIILRAIFEHKRVGVKSCSGSGKSFLSAIAILAFLYNLRPSTVPTTAPTYRQVEAILWRYIAVLMKRSRVYLDGNLTATGLIIKPDWFALGLSTDEPERFQGFHNKHVLVVGDEASGLPEQVYTAMENPMATGDAHMLLIGNPTQNSGQFYEAFRSERYVTFTISAFDTPNFTELGITVEDVRSGDWKHKQAAWIKEHGELPRPYLITPEYVADTYKEYGENSYQWQVYVLGQFPESGVNTLFKMADIERAVKRSADMIRQPDHIRAGLEAKADKVCSLDVSRYGDDETVFGTRIGRRIVSFDSWGHQDTIFSEGRTINKLKIEMPQYCVVDGVGVGSGVVDGLQHEVENLVVKDFNAGAAAVDKEHFGNRRSELYFKLNRMLENDEIDLPDDLKLKRQLLDVRYYYNRRGQLFIESKEEAKARGSASPDRVDAAVMLLDTTVRAKGGRPRVKYYY